VRLLRLADEGLGLAVDGIHLLLFIAFHGLEVCGAGIGLALLLVIVIGPVVGRLEVGDQLAQR
jgi:hypothetical protein